MSSRARGTGEDTPPATPLDRSGSVYRSTVSPAERDPSEAPPLAPVEVDPFVAPVDAALRVVAFLVAAGIIGIVVATAWIPFADWWAGRAPLDLNFISLTLFLLALPLLPLVRRLLRVAIQSFEREPGAAEIESRAFLEAVERHDRLRMEAQKLTMETAGGGLDTECRPERQAPPLHEPRSRADGGARRGVNSEARSPSEWRPPRTVGDPE
jgi:hypothetical protein